MFGPPLQVLTLRILNGREYPITLSLAYAGSCFGLPLDRAPSPAALPPGAPLLPAGVPAGVPRALALLVEHLVARGAHEPGLFQARPPGLPGPASFYPRSFLHSFCSLFGLRALVLVAPPHARIRAAAAAVRCASGAPSAGRHSPPSSV